MTTKTKERTEISSEELRSVLQMWIDDAERGIDQAKARGEDDPYYLGRLRACELIAVRFGIQVKMMADASGE